MEYQTSESKENINIIKTKELIIEELIQWRKEIEVDDSINDIVLSDNQINELYNYFIDYNKSNHYLLLYIYL